MKSRRQGVYSNLDPKSKAFLRPFQVFIRPTFYNLNVYVMSQNMEEIDTVMFFKRDARTVYEAFRMMYKST